MPPYSVVVSGSLPGKNLPGENYGPSLYCAVIVKKVDEQTRTKTSINELLATDTATSRPWRQTGDFLSPGSALVIFIFSSIPIRRQHRDLLTKADSFILSE